MNKAEIVEKLKFLILTGLPVEAEKRDLLDDTIPLFGDDGFGLDSLDAVEFVMLIEKNFGVAIDNAEKAKEICMNVSSVADYILEKSKNAEQ